MNLFPTVAKNTLVQISGRTGVILISLITTALLTRWLGTTGYGNYTFIIALVMFFVVMADWGTSLIFVREAAKNKTEEEKFYGNALLFRFLLAIVALILINILAILPVFSELSAFLKIASTLLILISLKTSCHIIFQTKLKFEFIALTDIIVSLFFLITLTFFSSFLYPTPTLGDVIFSFIFANLLGSGLAIFLATRLTKFIFQLDQQIIRKIVFEAMPTGALLLIFSIYNRLDIFLLQFFKGAEPVGIYGLAYRVHDNLILGAAYLTAALFPIISGIINSNQNFGKLNIIYRKTFDLLLMAGLVVLVGVFLLAPMIITVLGGLAFSESVLALRILVFATLLAYFNHLTGYTLIALGRQKTSLLVALSALVLNLGLNLILIPRYSYLGAAGVTVATEALVLVLTSFYLAKNFNLKPSLSFSRTLIEMIRTKGKIF